MNKGLRVFGHPLHAMLSDFPLALLGSSVLWDLVGLWRGEDVWWTMSFWTIALGLMAAMLAAVAGGIDYAAIPEKHPATGTALRHMLLMLTGVCPFVASILVRRGALHPIGSSSIIVTALDVLGFALLSAGGWFGGHLVFHYRIGTDAQSGDKTPDQE
jgi:uncharacterized membrane protein